MVAQAAQRRLAQRSGAALVVHQAVVVLVQVALLRRGHVDASVPHPAA